MKLNLVMLVGPPLSGKDTYIREERFEDYYIISRDDILMSLHSSNDYSEAFRTINPKQVDNILREQFEYCVRGGKNILINMTNLTKKSRNKHLEKVKDYSYTKTAIVFPKLDLEEYYRRNIIRKEKENKFIPKHIIDSMVGNWEDITISEGFDNIIKL